MQVPTHFAYSKQGMLPKQSLYLSTHRPSADFLEQSVQAVHVGDVVSQTEFPDEPEELDVLDELDVVVDPPQSSPP